MTTDGPCFIALTIQNYDKSVSFYCGALDVDSITASPLEGAGGAELNTAS